MKTAAWIAVFLAGLVWSAVNPRDYYGWFLEVFPAWGRALRSAVCDGWRFALAGY